MGARPHQVEGEFVGGTCGNSAELVESLGAPKCDDIESRTERGDEPLVDVGSGDGRELFKPHLGPALPEVDPQPRSHERRQRHPRRRANLRPLRRLRDLGRGRDRHHGAGGLPRRSDREHPHFTLVLADLSELTLARLDRCFDEPIPNPGRPPEG